VGLGKNKTSGQRVWLRDQTSKTFQKSNPLTPLRNLKNYFLYKMSKHQCSNSFLFKCLTIQLTKKKKKVFNNSNQLLFENFCNQTLILIKLLNLDCSIKLIV
jgi:hypothetical protein